MGLFEITPSDIVPVVQTSFRDQRLRERQDLQRLLRSKFDVVDPEVMILAEEFGDWDESKRRIDLLGLDRDARLVVVELKRTDDGGHMELQALRYAAMVSRMTFEHAALAHAKYSGTDTESAEQRILDFLDWSEPDEEQFAQDVRLVLVSADFSKEITTSVLWLLERDLDIRCVRLRPYELDGRVLIDVQQIVPLPEANDYIVQLREKERRERQSRSGRDYTRFDVTVDGTVHTRQAKRNAILLVVRGLVDQGITPDDITEVVDRKPHRLWRSAPGSLDSDAFDRAMRAEALAGGRAWDLRRWHCGDDDLIRSGGQTWALTNQWGGRTRENIERLLEAWPGMGISVRDAAA